MMDHRFSVGYRITNSGRTAATITDIQVFGCFSGSGPGNTPPPIQFSDKPMPPEWPGEAVIGAGQSIPQTYNPSLLASDDELRRTWQSEKVYWIQGRVRYKDVFGRSHYTLFTTRVFLKPPQEATFSFPLIKGYSDGD